MADGPRFARLPVLPSWEKLLERLYILPESEIDRKALQLELLGLASKESIPLIQLFSQLCAFLPKLIGCEGVVVWVHDTPPAQTRLDQTRNFLTRTRPLGGSQVIVSNLSAKKATSLIGARAITKLAQDGHYYFNRHCPVALQVNRKTMTHYQLISFGVLNRQEHYLLLVGSRPISSDTIRVFDVIKQVLSLRIKTEELSQHLRQQETKLVNLTQQLGEGMAVLDENLQITLWNRAMQLLTGFKAAQVLGQSVDQVLPRPDQANWFAKLVEQTTLKNSGHVWTDFELETKDGHKRWVNCLVSIYRNEAGQAQQVVVVARDISHTKTLEDQKNEFISIATHELRTPLTAVRGYLNLMERGNDNLTEKQLAHLAQAIKASNRLAGLTEDLLKVVQIEQNRIQFKPQLIRLGPLIKKIVRDFKPRAASRGLILSLSKPPGNDLVRLDPERTEQIFANLIDNALKYTQQGGVKISFEEQANNRDPKIIVNVRDTGIGINLKNTGEVFRKFHRAHRPEQSKEQGAGLGLYIVKSFVEKQSGTIIVKSKTGKGTHFVVTFPLRTAKQRSRG